MKMKNFALNLLCAIFLCTFCLSSCGHIHSYNEYGFCPECGEINQDTLEEFDNATIAIYQSFWRKSYEDYSSVDIYLPKKNYDIHREKTSFLEDSYLTEGYVLITDSNGDRYRSDYTIKFELDGEKFVGKDNTLSACECADESGNIRHYTLNHTFLHRRDGKKISELVFESNNQVVQNIYSYAGSLISTHSATYVMKRIPADFIFVITITSEKNGNVSTIKYVADDNTDPDKGGSLVWNGDIYYAE